MIEPNKTFKSRSGLTLVGVLTTATIGSVVMVAMATMTKNLYKAERGIASNLDLTQLIHTIRLLTDKDLCSKSGLVGINVGSIIVPSPVPSPLPSLEPIHVTLEFPGGPTLMAGMPFGNSSRNISMLALTYLIGINTNREYLANLHLETNVRGEAVTFRNPKSDITLRVTLDEDEKIISCNGIEFGPSSAENTTSETPESIPQTTCRYVVNIGQCDPTSPTNPGGVIALAQCNSDEEIVSGSSSCHWGPGSFFAGIGYGHVVGTGRVGNAWGTSCWDPYAQLCATPWAEARCCKNITVPGGAKSCPGNQSVASIDFATQTITCK